MSDTLDVFATGRKFLRDTRDARRDRTGKLLAGEVFEIDEDRVLREAIAEAAGVDLEVAAAIVRGDVPDVFSLDQKVAVKKATAQVIDSSEPLAFADQALRAALSVGRLALNGGAGVGTGFMISTRLLATAGHVILGVGDAADLRVEFNYDEFPGRSAVNAQFELDPKTLLLLPKDFGGIDLAIVALGKQIAGSEFIPVPCSLTDRGFAHPTGYHGNVIHCPRGMPQLVVRDNWLLLGDDIHLAYRSQTDAGSSGAPVFNAGWNPIALHIEGHTGEPLFQVTERVLIADEVNWGIRTHEIHKRLQQARETLDDEQKKLIDEAAPPVGGG